MELLAWPICVVGFLALYQWLRLRTERRTGERPPIQWWWLAAIVLAVAIAVVAGAAGI